MKKTIILLITGSVIAFWIALTSAEEAILEKLGVDHNSARYSIEEYFLKNSFSIPRAKLLKEVINGDKVGAAMELASYVKAHVISDEFNKKYQELRLAAKPTSEPERYSPETIAQMKQGLKAMEDMFNDPYMSSMFSKEDKERQMKSIEEMRESIREAEDPHPNKTRWEKNFPPDVKDMIKAKLNDYLALVETVDFNAQLTSNQYGRKIFVKQEYENKDNRWKACFRAGKEVNDQMKVFVKNWLKELN